MSSISSNTSSRKILRQISKSLSKRRRRFKNCLSGEEFPDRRTTIRWNPRLLLHQSPQSSGGHWCGLQDRCLLGEIKREEDEIGERRRWNWRGNDGTQSIALGLFVLEERSSHSHWPLPPLPLQFVHYFLLFFTQFHITV